MKNKFILGTAQLGMPYGIANTTGQPSLEHAKKIIQKAIDEEIFLFDTAQVYGTSEDVLATSLKSVNAIEKAKIITKVSYNDLLDQELLRKALTNSLHVFENIPLFCFMFHHEEYLPLLDAWQGEFLSAQKQAKTIKKIGFSVYSVEKAFEALKHPLVDVLQIPSSLFDRRFIKAGVFDFAKDLGKEIHVRSAFLQGVLCMSVERLPVYLLPLKKSLEKFHDICKEYSTTPTQAALFYLQNKVPDAYLIFGAENSTQVEENTDNKWQVNINKERFFQALQALEVPQESTLLNPSLWKK